jgi:hypothetical protein
VARAFLALEWSLGPAAHATAGKLAESLQAELLPLVGLSAVGERLYTKPRGYAGDCQTIEKMIYGDQPAGTLAGGPFVEGAMRGHSQPAPPARIGNRQILGGNREGILRRLTCLRSCLRGVRCLRRAGVRSRLNATCVDIRTSAFIASAPPTICATILQSLSFLEFEAEGIYLLAKCVK